MEEILTGEQSRFIDDYCINNLGIPSLILMEHAAEGMASVIIEKYIKHHLTGKVIIVSGNGNNGADGLACARILDTKGYPVVVLMCGNIENATEAFLLQRTIITNIGVECIIGNDEIMNYLVTRNPGENDILVDCIFGTGLSRNVTGDYEKIIMQINKLKSLKISADIPSGLNSQGVVMNVAVKSDITITFGSMKSGLILCDGRNYSGEVIVYDIGFRIEAYRKLKKRSECELFTYSGPIVKFLPKRNRVSNKGTYGKTAVIGGCADMPGAVFMAGKAAYRTGSGIVKIFSASENVNKLQTLLPEAIIKSFDNEIDISDCNVVALGPGIGISQKSYDIVKEVLKMKKRTVIDADALNIIANHKELLELFDNNTVITPHVKEMSRLCGKSVKEIREDIVSISNSFAEKYKCTCVIKDATTVISEGNNKIYVNMNGNNGMSTGGSGDVLTGIIASLISQGLSIYESACLGVYLHGAAGDEAAKCYSEYGLNATDIIECITNVIKTKI